MERKTYLDAAIQGTTSPQSDVKQPYTQAASHRQPGYFARKINYSLGVVERIHCTRTNTYARISTGRGTELSIKVEATSSYRPGTILQLTNLQTDHESQHTIYGVHPARVDDEAHPLCRGRVKWFDRNLKSWTVKTRSSNKYLRVETTNFKLLQDQTIYFIPSFSNGKIGIRKVMDVEGGVPEGTPPTWIISAPLGLRLKESFQKATILDPTTRSDSDRIPQLDLLRAETSLHGTKA